MKDKPDISIILPAIRPQNWDTVYDSLTRSCKRYTFELIIVSPFPLTEKLQAIPHVKYIKDFSSPVRASNMACLLAEAELITWIADDCIMLEDAIDKNLDIFLSLPFNYKNVILMKYYEGPNFVPGYVKPFQPDSYWQIKSTPIRDKHYVPEHWYTYSNPIMYRRFYEELGGLDCDYECTPMAYFDFGLRAQELGAITQITQIPHMDADHGQSDHQAVHVAQLAYDEPRVKDKYSQPDWRTKFPLRQHLFAWKNYPLIWVRRYNRYLPTTYDDIRAQNWTVTM